MVTFLMKLITGLIAVVLLLSAGMVAATWEPDRSVEELRERWAPPPSQFIEVGGQFVHLRDEGPRQDTTPIVLLHGTSASLHTWDGWVAELSQTRRVIRFDLPGFGLTGPAADGNYSLAAYVDFVIDVMDTLGIERFVLAGNSLGGSIAWRTTAAHPQRIEKLILVDSGGYPFEAESMPLAFVISQTPLLNRIMEFTLPRSAVESSVRDVYGDPSRVTPELVDRYFDLSLREGNRGALRERFAQLEYQDQSALVQTIQQPTLVIWGAQDRLIPPSIARRFEQDLPNGQLVMFAELGHVPHEEAPTETVAAVTKFL
ncbi:MAG: alpha/beta hydrolase [Pseudomonadales bacterium]|nr:alpha/beta hydrolase [Pseudomonadales bacterium]MBI27307.1 alpha/beta hydrolase [Pseudomonadales bacterium]HAG96435.1 alpha/beta hydrolase [Gammaproteobacteria bacterium]HAU12463.1 alpha/beta hydrolase [Gammaproteobacteria bacterium]HBO92300.1 alpha/beta hydrolase [Gammaproteobacteria bacterium]